MADESGRRQRTSKPEYIVIGPEHMGQHFIRAFNELWFVGNIGRPSGFVPEDIGRRLYRVEANEVAIEGDEDKAERDRYPTIFYVCELLNGTLLQEETDDHYAVGQPCENGAITPWFATLAELETYCNDNIQSLRTLVRPS
jgi:hypothetical protein